ncbi:hypothetical protein [Haloarchaeobius baliensis]|uniref:outer membrane lipoprotein-sorting protein n=1 Tax=Haloarchaeobius baliensis TaxID=1670458 RepID=UPI003F880AE4
MVHRSLRVACLCLVLLSSTTLAGCLDDAGTDDAAMAPETTADGAPTHTETASQADEPDGEAVVAAFRDRMSSLEGYVATRRTNLTVGDDSTTTEVRLWARPATGELRQEILAPEARAGTVVLVNESATTVYDPDAEQVTTYQRSSGSLAVAGLPIQSLLERTTVEFVGTEERDGEEQYRVRFVPDESTAGNTTLVGWLDTETYFPERIVSTSTVGEDEYTTVTTFENVELGVDIADSRFGLDLPEGVARDEYDTPDVTTFDNIDLLRTNTSLHVPAADVPSGFALGRASLAVGNEERATLRYTNGSASLYVLVQNRTGETVPSNAEAVDLDGRTVHYAGDGEGGYLQWECGGQTYVVSGPLSRATLLEIAASMHCA